jgi:hypothetical protein
MSLPAGDTVPEPLRRRLDGRRPTAQVGFTVLLLTVSPEGWPRVAMLSPGEVLARRRTLRLALWPQSATTANLARTRRCTVAAVAAGSGWYLLCAAHPFGHLEVSQRRLAAFQLRVEQVLEDRVPYAELTGGIRYRLSDPERVVPVWEETLAALRERR